MTSKLQRFDFGALRDFRGPAVPPPVVQQAIIEDVVATPPEPTFTQAEIDVARELGKQEGYAQGMNDGVRQAMAGVDLEQKKASVVILKLMETMRGIDTRYTDILKLESANLTELVLMITRKIAGEALDARSVETITALITRCMPVIFSRPRLIIDLHPDRLVNVAARIEEVLGDQHYEGEIQFRANEKLGEHDVALDWGTGQASQNSAALWQEIETLLARVPLEMTFEETLNQTQK